MRARAKRRLRKAWDVIRKIVSLGQYVVPHERTREVLGQVNDAAEALDPNEKALRDDYGVPPDRGSR